MWRQFIALCIVAVLPTSVLGKTFLGHELQQHTLIVKTDEGDLHFRPINPESVEVSFNKPNVKQLDSFALADSNTSVPFALQANSETLIFSSKELQIVIKKQPFSVAFKKNGKTLLEHESGFFSLDSMRGVRFKLQEQEKLLGGGQRVLGMDRRGQRLKLYNQTFWGYSYEAKALYYSLPGVLSSNKYILVFDNSAKGYLDLGKSDKDVMQLEAVAGRNAYIFVAADDYPELMDNYTKVTGKQPLPPRWALGSFASRFGYHSEEEVRNVVKLYQQQDIPLDAVIIDIYWFGKDVRGHMGSLDWERETFPTGEKMIQDFKADNIKTLLVTEPYFINTSKQWQSAVEEGVLAKNLAGDTRKIDMFFGLGGLIDIFDPKAQDWFWNHYDRLFKQGVAGVWGDLGEPEAHPSDVIHAIGSADEVHNAFGHTWAGMLYNKHLQHYPDDRLFILMRAGFAGSQRYGMLPWTGDVERSWGGLSAQVELSLQMGLLGLAYNHSDLGGFARGDELDTELYIRWLQYGVFQPIYRVHGLETVAPEPVFHDEATKNIVRNYIKLRYQLLPYIYTLSYENSTSGMPMMRPLFFAEPDKLSAMDYKDGYFWGDAFWVNPIDKPNLETKTEYLPEGYWFNFWDDSIKLGGKQFESKVTLEQIPVWVKAGSFVPMAPPHNNTEQYHGEQVIVHYYHHDSVSQAQGQLYQDDGKYRNSLQEQRYSLFQFSAQNNKNALTLEAHKSGNGYQEEPERRQFIWTIHNIQSQPKAVSINGETTQALADQKALSKATTGFWFDPTSQQLNIVSAWNNSTETIRIKVIQ
ncbi:DUF4968 domain-containing protein [Paraneptunicella aestuarii]|uniref:TIM-barrel domain-containing protein n=1 Tax=Paraneptunicella aestuarii TaxID=2831148 RepID=UPI001E429B47|nr:TIM-barrel domain-containing protein [Paraneptunicella aestuarii]UAA40573.1 DUF4968 domain-containing protein [Paraneptunicella aestuarii]